jgi:hypothetical protein
VFTITSGFPPSTEVINTILAADDEPELIEYDEKWYA